MYLLKVESSFDAAHFLAGYEGKCRNIHGHRWKIVIEVCGGELESEGQTRGMLVDFGDVKSCLREETDVLDHSLIVEKGSLGQKMSDALHEENFKVSELDFRPTAENLARYFYERMKKRGYNVKSAQVFETPENAAVYWEDK